LQNLRTNNSMARIEETE